MAAPMSLHDFDVLEPTYCRSNQIDFAAKDQLKYLVNIISAFFPCQSQHAKILSELKILNLVLYRRGGQLRKAKCFQLLKRVQACLKRFGKFEKLFQLLLTLNTDLKSAASSDQFGKKPFYLPAGQSWTYVLYLQKLYKQLLESTATYCIATFEHLSQQLAIGWLISSMVVFMGIVARIWALCETLTEKVVESYNKIYPYKELFQPSASDWVEPYLPPFLCSTRNTSPTIVDNLMCSQKQETQHEAPGIPLPDEKWLVQHEEDIGEPVIVKRKTKLHHDGIPKKFRNDNHEDIIPLSSNVTKSLQKSSRHEKKEKLHSGSQTESKSLILKKKKKKKKPEQIPDDKTIDLLSKTLGFKVEQRKAVTCDVVDQETHHSRVDHEAMTEVKISKLSPGIQNVSHKNKLKRKKKKKKQPKN